MSLRNAFAYLTALRVPPRARTPLTRSLHYFPWFAAAFGSLNVLGYIAVSGALPSSLACLFAVLLPQVLAGFSPARGALEAAQGIRTLPGHGFAPGFRGERRGYALAAALLAAKWGALMLLSPDERVRAAFVFPILGLCARAFAFLLDARRHHAGGKAFAGRRVRAAFLGGALLFLVFLFPPRTALAILAGTALAGWLVVRPPRRLFGKKGERAHDRLTLQTAALASEVVEVAMLAVAAGAAVLRSPPHL